MVFGMVHRDLTCYGAVAVRGAMRGEGGREFWDWNVTAGQCWVGEAPQSGTRLWTTSGGTS